MGLTEPVFSGFTPTFGVAQKILLFVGLQKLADTCEGLIAFSAAGSQMS